MREYDPQVAISEEIRGNQLLENSGLNRDQQNMILVSTQNKLDYDLVKDALIAQHGIAHMGSHNYHARHQPQGRTAIGYQRPWGKGRGKDHRGYIAESYDDSQDQEEYQEDYEDYGDTADDYTYDDDYEYEYEYEQDDDYEQEEQYGNEVEAYLVQSAENDEYDWEDQETSQAFADAMQYSDMAYFP